MKPGQSRERSDDETRRIRTYGINDEHGAPLAQKAIEDSTILLAKYPDRGIPQQKNARLRLANAMGKYKSQAENNLRDLEKALMLFKIAFDLGH